LAGKQESVGHELRSLCQSVCKDSVCRVHISIRTQHSVGGVWPYSCDGIE